MQLYVGVTDNDWYEYLANNRPDELNFWQPGERQRLCGLRIKEAKRTSPCFPDGGRLCEEFLGFYWLS